MGGCVNGSIRVIPYAMHDECITAWIIGEKFMLTLNEAKDLRDGLDEAIKAMEGRE